MCSAFALSRSHSVSLSPACQHFFIYRMEITSTSDRKCSKLTKNKGETKTNKQTKCSNETYIEIVTPIISICVLLSSILIEILELLIVKFCQIFCSKIAPKINFILFCKIGVFLVLLSFCCK